MRRLLVDLPDRITTLPWIEFLRETVRTCGRQRVAIARALGMSDVDLCRRLTGESTDLPFPVERFTDLLDAIGPTAAVKVVQYLVAEYLAPEEERHARLGRRVEAILPELGKLLERLNSALQEPDR